MTPEQRIEAVTMAIWVELGGKNKAALDRAAKVAILATLQSLREPSEAMVGAADAVTYRGYFDLKVWRAMIDAAIKETS